jgi:hypothetical protein
MSTFSDQSISQENLHTWNSSKAIARVGTKTLPITVGSAAHDDDDNDDVGSRTPRAVVLLYAQYREMT